MQETVKAIYEQGNFRPLEPLKIQLNDGQIVRLTIIKVEENEEDQFRFDEETQG